MKRKVKVWNKIKLYETSVVGIPAYPDAHASVESFSLVKALSNASLKGFVEEANEISNAQLNLGEVKNTMEKETEKQEVTTSEVSEKDAKAEPKSVDMSEVVAKAIKDGLKEAMEKLETERGLVAKQEVKQKSIGEMALDMGLFKQK